MRGNIREKEMVLEYVTEERVVELAENWIRIPSPIKNERSSYPVSSTYLPI